MLVLLQIQFALAKAIKFDSLYQAVPAPDLKRPLHKDAD